MGLSRWLRLRFETLPENLEVHPMVLLKIILVSFSSRGHQLVCSYPSDDSKTLGFDSSFLADILSPKTSLCDQKFHLKVHGIDFLGHPTLLNVDRPGTGLVYSRVVKWLTRRKCRNLF